MVVLGGGAVSYQRSTPVTPSLTWCDKCTAPSESLSQGLKRYLAHQKTPNPLEALCPETFGDPMGVGISYERGTPAVDDSHRRRIGLLQRSCRTPRKAESGGAISEWRLYGKMRRVPDCLVLCLILPTGVQPPTGVPHSYKLPPPLGPPWDPR